jgi:hypothetical protein
MKGSFDKKSTDPRLESLLWQQPFLPAKKMSSQSAADKRNNEIDLASHYWYREYRLQLQALRPLAVREL